MGKRFKGRDFLEIRAECIQFLKERLKDAWTDQGEADELLALVEAISYVGDTLHFYIDNQKRECDIVTASIQRNVFQKAMRDGYKPHICRAAVGTLHITFKEEPEKDILLPRGTLFSTEDDPIPENNIVCCLLEDTVIPAGSSYCDIEVSQGTLVTESHSRADITQFGYIKLGTDMVAEGLSSVYHAGYKWEEVEDVYTDYKTGRIFSVHPYYSRSENLVMVQFPYNWGMYIVDNGAIEVTYLKTLGIMGNITSGRVTKVMSVIRDVDNKDVTSNLVITNPHEITGGMDFESVESVRTNFKDSIRELKTLVTLDDYEAFTRLYTGEDAVAIDWRTAPEVVIEPRKIIILVSASEEVVEHLQEELEQRQGRGDEIEIRNALYEEYSIEAVIKLAATGDSEETIRNNILNELSVVYDTPPQKGNPVYISRLISIMQQASPRVLSVKLISPTEDVIPVGYVIAKYTDVDLTFEVS